MILFTSNADRYFYAGWLISTFILFLFLYMKLVSINLFIAALHINRGTETIRFLKFSNQKSQSKSPVKIFVNKQDLNHLIVPNCLKIKT